MKAVNLFETLRNNTYPGRGIAIGKTPCGKKIRIAYFIMGRSENSRNRIFVEEADGIRTEAFDPSKMVDPSLIIYAPVRVYKDTTIVTNGDQTDTIYECLAEGGTFEDALRTRDFEPDGPNFTPRISAIVKGDFYELSIVKSAEGNPDAVRRYFYDYRQELPGYGHLIHTYESDGNPLPSFEGEPTLWQMEKEPFEEFSDHLWDALNPDNKVSLFTRVIDLESGETRTRIYNRNK
ncbi:MAG: IMP cyclohydrolase [Solobacterium sp.]|nr:IMP cyclohydrolase [Solobacterium sp.]MBR2794340.1 IMP cyclohydrolase [Solobacterium sp.]